MSHDRAIKSIEFEITEIDELFEAYSVLIEYCQKSVPDLIEMSAMAVFLHSFYNGIENIFVVIAKEMDKSVPKNVQWHSVILVQMSESTSKRKAIITNETLDVLKKYLAFRHFFRHAYSFKLDWENLRKPSESVIADWNKVKKEIQDFVKNSDWS